MILKTRMTDHSRKNIAILKARHFSAADRITAGYIIGIAADETARLPEEEWKAAVNDMLHEKEASGARSSSTSVSLRQSVYEQLCQAQERVRKLGGRDTMSQVIDLILFMAARRIGADSTAMIDSLAVMEWNINARSARQPGYCIPVNLIANTILGKCPHIFVLTEFVQAGGWLDLKAILSETYDVYTSPYQPRQNGICIGIRRDSGITYLGGQARDFPDGPDFYEARVRINGEDVSVIGARIRIGSGSNPAEYQQRFAQFSRLIEHIKPLESVIVLGDFNNARILGDEDETDRKKIDEAYRGKDSRTHNYQKMRAAVTAETGGKLLLSTAEGDAASVGARWVYAPKEGRYRALPPKQDKTQKHKYDHIITNSHWQVKAEYNWDFLDFYGLEQFEKDNKIKAAYPDHAFLLAGITLSRQGGAASNPDE